MIEYILDTINLTTRTCSLVKYEVFFDVNGKEVARSKPHRCAVVPGEVDKVKEFMGIKKEESAPFLENVLNSLWTPEVISAYEAQQEDYRINQLKGIWPDLPNNKNIWTNEQKQVYNNEVDISKHIPLTEETK